MAMSTRTKLKIVAPICIVGGAALTVAGFLQNGLSARVAAEGVVAKAEVVAHKTIDGRRGSKTLKLVVTYGPDGAGPKVTKEFKASQALFDRVGDGEEVDVRYLPSDPSASELVGEEETAVAQIGPGVLVGLFGVIASYFVYRKRAVAQPSTA